MRFKNKNKSKKVFGPITTMIIISLIIIVVSAITSLLGVQSEKTIINNGILETSLIKKNKTIYYNFISGTIRIYFIYFR